MSWVRIDDKAMTHPKIVGLTDRAFRLWVWGLAYCQQHLTDGAIPFAALTPVQVRTTADLVNGRLWDCHDSGWQVHDYCDWNDSRTEVEDKRIKARERMRGVRANFPRRTSDNVPVRLGSVPPLDLSLKKREEEKIDPFDERFLQFWATYPKKTGKGAAWNVWRKLRPDQALTDRILLSIRAHQSDLQWQKEGGQFIPFPATFLSQRRFEDELQPPSLHVSQGTSNLAQAARDFSQS